MKRFNSIVLSILAVAGLASCELKDELKGGKTDKADTGILELGVTVKQPVTQTRATISTDNFPVTITGTSSEVIDVLKEYATVNEVPTSIVLPVGEYDIASHTPGKLEKKMDAPYYAGSTHKKITKDLTSEVVVTCTMKNSRIQLSYGEDFKSAFQSWTITIDDGSNSVLAYTESDLTPTPIYWHFDEETVNAITVNIKAKTTQGNSVQESRVFRKSDASEQYEDVTEFFTGGDALHIKMGAIEASNGSVNGINITTSIIFDDHEEEVEIPIYDGKDPEIPVDPVDPVDPSDGPSLQLPADVTYSLSDETSIPASADAIIKANDGLQSIIVTIDGGNDAFQDILNDLKMDGQSFIDGGVDIVDNADFNGLLATCQLPNGPSVGDTEYVFPIGVFFSFLNVTGATDAGKAHEFHITITDKNGATQNGTFKVTITD